MGTPSRASSILEPEETEDTQPRAARIWKKVQLAPNLGETNIGMQMCP